MLSLPIFSLSTSSLVAMAVDQWLPTFCWHGPQLVTQLSLWATSLHPFFLTVGSWLQLLDPLQRGVEQQALQWREVQHGLGAALGH